MRIWVRISVLAGMVLLLAGADLMAQTPAPGENPNQPANQVTSKPTSGPGATGTAPGPGPQRSTWWLWAMIGGFFLLYIWMSRGNKKKQRDRKDMLATIKKGDKVMTIGGIHGTVMEVRDNQVTLKVDESSNTRMKFDLEAIRSAADESGKDPGKSED